MRENQIKKLRQSQNLSQEMLAEKAQVSVRTIQRLEAGEEASVETLNLVWKKAVIMKKKLHRLTRNCSTN